MWWREAVIYEVYVRSFFDSDGDGVGDLRGVLDKLDYLSRDLGVDALWLSPFFLSPGRDYGYDVADHVAVDPRLGTIQTFDEIVVGAHDRGLKVLIDYVPNHTSDEHPWFIDSRSSLSSAKRGWYVWADPKPGGSPPNNWLSAFGGPGWTFDNETGQYYLHSFLKEMPDLNWRNPEVEEAMFGMVSFWMERGVDGIRIDCAHFLMKDPQMRDNPLNPEREILGHRSLGEYDSQVHLYDKGHEDIHPLYRRLRTLLDSYEPDRTSIGEIHIFDWAQWAAYYGTELDELHMSFNFGLLGVPWDPTSVRALIEQVYLELPDEGWPNWVIGNHDEPRIASRLGSRNARMALVLVLALRGTPTIYYGDELGFTDAPLSPKGTMDPWGLQDPSLSRDPQRAPMAWDTTDHAGFCPPGVEPWAPLPLESTTLSVATQLEDENSFLGLTRRALELRRSSAALRRGSLEFTDAPEGCLAFTRIDEDESLWTILNFSDEPVPVAIESLSLLLRSSRPAQTGPISGEFVVQDQEACVFALDIRETPDR